MERQCQNQYLGIQHATRSWPFHDNNAYFSVLIFFILYFAGKLSCTNVNDAWPFGCRIHDWTTLWFRLLYYLIMEQDFFHFSLTLHFSSFCKTKINDNFHSFQNATTVIRYADDLVNWWFRMKRIKEDQNKLAFKSRQNGAIFAWFNIGIRGNFTCTGWILLGWSKTDTVYRKFT